VKIQRERFASVVAMTSKAALAFFGFGPEAIAIDAGAADPGRWKPGARRWRVYRNAADLRADESVPS
jgi:hypothetical protein